MPRRRNNRGRGSGVWYQTFVSSASMTGTILVPAKIFGLSLDRSFKVLRAVVEIVENRSVGTVAQVGIVSCDSYEATAPDITAVSAPHLVTNIPRRISVRNSRAADPGYFDPTYPVLRIDIMSQTEPPYTPPPPANFIHMNIRVLCHLQNPQPRIRRQIIHPVPCPPALVHRGPNRTNILNEVTEGLEGFSFM